MEACVPGRTQVEVSDTRSTRIWFPLRGARDPYTMALEVSALCFFCFVLVGPPFVRHYIYIKAQTWQRSRSRVTDSTAPTSHDFGDWSVGCEVILSLNRPQPSETHGCAFP